MSQGSSYICSLLGGARFQRCRASRAGGAQVRDGLPAQFDRLVEDCTGQRRGTEPQRLDDSRGVGIKAADDAGVIGHGDLRDGRLAGLQRQAFQFVRLPVVSVGPVSQDVGDFGVSAHCEPFGKLEVRWLAEARRPRSQDEHVCRTVTQRGLVGIASMSPPSAMRSPRNIAGGPATSGIAALARIAWWSSTAPAKSVSTRSDSLSSEVASRRTSGADPGTGSASGLRPAISSAEQEVEVDHGAPDQRADPADDLAGGGVLEAGGVQRGLTCSHRRCAQGTRRYAVHAVEALHQAGRFEYDAHPGRDGPAQSAALDGQAHDVFVRAGARTAARGGAFEDDLQDGGSRRPRGSAGARPG